MQAGKYIYSNYFSADFSYEESHRAGPVYRWWIGDALVFMTPVLIEQANYNHGPIFHHTSTLTYRAVRIIAVALKDIHHASG